MVSVCSDSAPEGVSAPIAMLMDAVVSPFPFRQLQYNLIDITSLASGAFSGLTSLTSLWARSLLTVPLFPL